MLPVTTSRCDSHPIINKESYHRDGINIVIIAVIIAIDVFKIELDIP